MESLFRCPVCGAPLDRGDRAYRCPAGHSYDIAREGYTYLLPPNQKHSADPGDDRDMAAARRDFLSKGYYDPLLNTLCCQILSLSGESPVIWDVGCGEGFYTSGIFRTLAAAGKSPRMAGTDISKPILRSAAKREKGIAWAVASSFHLPAADGAADVILIDCPPSFTAASMAAIAASTGVIIPIKLDAWALAGMRELSAQIDSLRMVNEFVRVDGCLITQWHNSEVIRQAEGRLRAGAWPVYSTVIRRTDKADESTFASMALSDYSRWSSAARDYRAFVAEWLERGGVSSGRQV